MAPNCSLGCDSLYGRGYITVDEAGRIRVSPLADTMPGVHEHIQQQHLADRAVPWSAKEREPHFRWHRAHTFEPDPPA